MAAPSNRTIRYFGDYVLFGLIAEGAMGEVWFARQDSLNRAVAVKLIRAGALATAAEVNRFRIEAEAAARLSHKNIVRVFEVGEHEGRHFLSMELIEGGSLATQIKEGAWRLDAASGGQRQRDLATLMATVARAVHHAHQRGVLHRDIKPANILLDERGEPHLSDFGLAKLLDAEGSLTQPGAVLGTLCYMSPEQAAGKSAEATTASDIYSLGSVLYELLAGRPAFQHENAAELLRQVVEQEPLPPRKAISESSDVCRPKTDYCSLNTDSSSPIDRDLETICLKCLEKAPARRYASAEALADDLERWLRGEPIHARPVGDLERAWKWVRRHPVTASLSAALGLALVLGLATTTWQWLRVERQRALTSAALALSQLQRAEDFFGSEKAHLALPILARVLRDDPANRVAQERFVNALNHRAFLAPLGPPASGSSAEVQLALRIARTADGTRAATATNEDATMIQLWDARNGARLDRVFAAHSNVIRSLTFRPDGRRLVSASADGTVKIWEADTLRLLATLPHPAAVHSAEFSPDGEIVLTACRDGIARLWNAESGKLLTALPRERSALNVARFDPADGRMATGADDGTVQIWTIAANGFRRFSEPFVLPHAVWNLEFLPESVWGNVGQASSLTVHGASVPRVSGGKMPPAPSGKMPVPHFKTHYNALVATLDDGATFVLRWTHPASAGILPASSPPGTRRQDAGAPGPPQPIAIILGRPAAQFHSAPITSTDVSPGGRLLATASLDRTARLWDARTLVPTTEPLVHDAPVNCVRFSGDGLRVVTSTPGSRARVWDAATGQPLTGWMEFEQPVAHAAFASDDTRLVTSSGEAWPIHSARRPAPPWLAELAEALGGFRLDETGRVEPATPFADVCRRLTSSAETDALALWAKQLFGGPRP